MLDVPITCPFCGKRYTVKVPSKGYFDWSVRGRLIQHAMPEVDANVREALISGICQECWDRTMG